VRSLLLAAPKESEVYTSYLSSKNKNKDKKNKRKQKKKKNFFERTCSGELTE